MSVKSLVADPDFEKLSPEEKQGLLASVDPDFKNLGVNEIDQVVQGIRGGPIQQKPSLIKQGWDALAIPEQKSKEGLQMIAKAVSPNQEVTGNLPRDIAMNLPRIGMETLAETAPGFISRGAILTAGALKGAGMVGKSLKPIAKGLAPQLESASGSVPGSLEAAYKDPSLIFSPGKKAVQPLYEAGKKIGGEVGSELAQTPGKIEFVQKASQMADEGKLLPTEALEARKELDLVKKRVTGEFFRSTRDKLDKIAKIAFSEADPAYKKASMAESLRNIIPQNKYGGASAFKMGIAPALTGLGGFVAGPPGAAIGAGIAAGTLSPIVQGAAATGAGIAARAASPLVNNPLITSEAINNLSKIFTLKPDIEALKKGQKIEAKPIDAKKKRK